MTSRQFVREVVAGCRDVAILAASAPPAVHWLVSEPLRDAVCWIKRAVIRTESPSEHSPRCHTEPGCKTGPNLFVLFLDSRDAPPLRVEDQDDDDLPLER